MAALIPEEYGGSGLGLTEASIIMEEINRAGGNSGACHCQMYNVNTLVRDGSEEQRQKYLPRIASGELRIQSMGVTEPTTETDTTKIKTTAIKRRVPPVTKILSSPHRITPGINFMRSPLRKNYFEGDSEQSPSNFGLSRFIDKICFVSRSRFSVRLAVSTVPPFSTDQLLARARILAGLSMKKRSIVAWLSPASRM